MIVDSHKRQNANSRQQSNTTHLDAPPETPIESETYQSPYSIGPLQHYFYDLRSTPTLDTDSFTPRQRKQRLCLVISLPLLLPPTLTT